MMNEPSIIIHHSSAGLIDFKLLRIDHRTVKQHSTTYATKHATKHFHATTHPVIRSFEPGEDWSWRYVETIVLEPPR